MAITIKSCIMKLPSLSLARGKFTSFQMKTGTCMRTVTTSTRLCCEAVEGEPDTRDIPPEKDRRNPVSLEVGLAYLKSQGYNETYGKHQVWVPYTRNYIGPILPSVTRHQCVTDGVITTGNPCPICRDEFLVVDYRNIDLLKQFICPYTGAILPTLKTQVCQIKHREISSQIMKARDYGYITFEVPFKEYDYNEYFDFDKWETKMMI